jgi:outer membrane immunogenic protein
MCDSIRRGGTLLFAILCVALSGRASAEQSSADLVLQKIAALEARVAALETKNQQYRHEAEVARAQARDAERFTRSPSVAANYSSRASLDSPSVAKATFVPQKDASWDGFFWGASAGGASTRSRVSSSETVAQTSVSPGFSSVNGYQSFAFADSDSGGGFLDLFGGANLQISRFVIGGQLEATVADLDFNASGSKNYAYYGASAGFTAVSDFRPQINARWMTSALLRAGVLVDDQTLIYGLGGWTGARLEARNVTDNPFYQPRENFWANGWTAGAGIERRLDAGWSVRAEYRYADLGDVRTSDHFTFSQSGPTSSSQSLDRQSSYHQSMQSGRIGVAYSFGTMR